MKVLLDNALGHIAITRMLPYWKNMGVSITTNPNEKHDAMLSFVRFGMNTKQPRILRLDGLYYDSDTQYNGRNTAISEAHASADGIVYQSIHSSKMCERYLSKRRKNARHTIIYNGVQKDWCGSPIAHDGINIAVANKHRRHKRLKEIIDLFIQFLRYDPNSTLHIFGRLHDNKEVKHPKIKYYGQVERDKLIDVYRRTDMSIHLSKRDSCPNSVVEYLGAGIPVITTNNCGGATEMCRMSEGCYIIEGDGDYDNLDPVPHYRDSWNVLPDIVSSGILEAMIKVAKERPRAVMSDVLTSEHMAKCYLQYIYEVVGWIN